MYAIVTQRSFRRVQCSFIWPQLRFLDLNTWGTICWTVLEWNYNATHMQHISIWLLVSCSDVWSYLSLAYLAGSVFSYYRFVWHWYIIRYCFHIYQFVYSSLGPSWNLTRVERKLFLTKAGLSAQEHALQAFPQGASRKCARNKGNFGQLQGSQDSVQILKSSKAV